jgi:hypothetical protein
MHTLRVAFHLYVWRIFQLPITRLSALFTSAVGTRTVLRESNNPGSV